MYSFCSNRDTLPRDLSIMTLFCSNSRFTHGGQGNWKRLKDNIDGFLAEYEPGYWANAGASQTKCNWDRPPLERDEACEFNLEWLSNQGSDIKCISEEHYGNIFGL